jgi:hypothetical protein
MSRLIRTYMVLAAFALWSCSDGPTDSSRRTTAIRADPTSLSLPVGESATVVVMLTDEGSQIPAQFTAGEIGMGITVVEDTAFEPTTVGPADQHRFIVTAGPGALATSFKVSAAGADITIPVRVVPGATADLAISDSLPALSDQVTVTVSPPGALFTDRTDVVLGGSAPHTLVSISPDRTRLILVPGPNAVGPITVTHMTVAFDQSLDFTVSSRASLTTRVVDSVPATLSNASPAGGEVVSLRLPFDDQDFSIYGAGVTVGGVPAVVTFAGWPLLNFIPTPGSSGPVYVEGVGVGGFAMSLPATTPPLTAGTAVAPLEGTEDPETAPTIETPPFGGSRGIVDGKSYGYDGCGDLGIDCQVYKLVIYDAGTYAFNLGWGNLADLALYILAADGRTSTGIACNKVGRGTDNQPEECSGDLTPGTYYIAVVPLHPEIDPNPDWVRISVTTRAFAGPPGPWDYLK